MNKIWLGDFRGKQLQQYIENIWKVEEAKKEAAKKKKETDNETSDASDAAETEIAADNITDATDIYLMENEADYYWFENQVLTTIPSIAGTGGSVIFMLGFNDCVRSCVWDTFNDFKIEVVINKYITLINKILEEYKSINFYVCAINPIQGDYPFSEHENGIIPKDKLIEKITLFNETIKSSCEVMFIDSYTYLTDAGFQCRDGVRFVLESVIDLYNYIQSQLLYGGTFSTFPLRAEIETDAAGNIKSVTGRPPLRTDEDGSELSSFNYWISNTAGGYSRCISVQDNCTLPNCVGYAWGRFMEIAQSIDNNLLVNNMLSANNAEDWFANTGDGYERSNGVDEDVTTAIPRPGAVVCWHSAHSGGHVAIIEAVLDNNTIVTSESGWISSKPKYNPPLKPTLEDSSWHFRVRVRTRGDDGNWASTSGDNKKRDGYTFQGFIYNPAVTASGGTFVNYVAKSQVTSVNEWIGHMTPEAKLNARYIWQYFGSRGWTLNAVAGMLGNMQAESHINPGIWQDTKAPPVDRFFSDVPYDSDKGYGLVQWTPYTKFTTNWCKYMIEHPEENTYGVTGTAENDYGIGDIDNALRRIEYEVANNRQWGSNYKEGDITMPTFKEFTTSNADPRILAAIFVSNYEVCEGWWTDTTRNYRGDNAEKWYEYLLPFAPGAVAPISIESVKVSSVEPTSVKISCIVRSATKVICKLLDSTGKVLKVSEEILKTEEEEKATIAVTTDVTEEHKENSFEKFAGKVVYFEYSDLVPNTEYKIYAEATDDYDVLNKTIIFSTPQDFPASVCNIALIAENHKMPDNKFILITEPISRWGYWEKNIHGYIIQLIVNGKVIQEKTITNLSKKIDFELSTYFPKYEKRLNDTIQIGIRTWVTDDQEQLIFDDQASRTSNSICFLRQPFITYINTN